MTDDFVKSEKLLLRDADEYNPSYSAKIPDQAAGIYITEDRIDCVVGTLYDDSENDKVIHIAPPVPRTKNEGKTKRLHTEIYRNGRNVEILLEEAVQWLADVSENLQSIVIGCFGPFESLDGRGDRPDESNEYGRLSYLQHYPLWSEKHLHFLFCTALMKSMGRCPTVRIFSDVDVAAYGEYWYRYSLLPDVKKAPFFRQNSIAFIKVSRSIGVGFAHRGALWRGRMHTMAGAIPVQRYARTIDGHERLDRFPGTCSFHGACLEGLIGQDAIEERTGLPYAEVDEGNDWLWDMIAHYIAMLCVTVCSVSAPSQIIIGGRMLRASINMPHAESLLMRVKGHFYNYIDSNDSNLTSRTVSPFYNEIVETEEFLSLPSRPILKETQNERLAMPGRHGALRLAAAKIYERRKSSNGLG